MDGVDMDLYALVANKLLAERIAAQNAARVSASSIAVPRSPTAADVQPQKRASDDTFVAPGEISGVLAKRAFSFGGAGRWMANLPGRLADAVGPTIRGWGTEAGEALGKAQNFAGEVNDTLNKGFGKLRGIREHAQRATDAAYINIKNPVPGVPHSPEVIDAATARNAKYVKDQKKARQVARKTKPQKGSKAPTEGASLSDRAKELLGAGAMAGYSVFGDDGEKTGGRRVQSRGAGPRKPAPPPTPPGTKPNPPKAGKTPGGAATASPPAAAAAGAGATSTGMEPGQLSRHLENIYNMTGDQWQSRGMKRVKHLGAYMAQNHPLASAGLAAGGGLAAMYGARKLYRDFLGGGEQERPKITIGM